MAADDTADFREGFPFLGGATWIDVLNTTPVIDGEKQDLIADTARLRHWAGLSGHGQAGFPSDRDLDAVHSLRETLRQVFDLLTQGQTLPPDLLAPINELLGGVAYRRKITAQGVEMVPAISGPAVAATIADDFADFLAAFQADRLRHCANPACEMVFYDRGKSNRRRWCSMQACGNRDKVAAYRARHAKT